METTIQKGWSYISAIFQVLLQKSDERESLIEPQYIFRGITKRWFSTSVLIEENKNDIIENIQSIARNDDDINALSSECQKWIKQLNEGQLDKLYELESKALYQFLYERFKHAIKTEETKLYNNEVDNKSFELLKMIMQPPKSNDKNSIIHKDYTYCVPEYINSGAVVRLKEGSPHPSNLDYVNYIKHMLNDLKIRFPEYNDDNYSDIEVLADVQHKGAATCLADFSTNFLTTLWFATQEYNEDIGYLFCYDINKALIEKDKLFILNNKHVKRDIEDLLYETSKVNKTYRNWLWRPSNLNERIAMQDSVFIFGLEPFKIVDNDIIAIPIPPHWKKPIQYVLRVFFGITAESVFCDVEGYSDANSKTRPYTKTYMHYFNDRYGLKVKDKYVLDSDSKGQDNNEYSLEYLQCGMDCLFQGEYELALEYFKYYKADTGNDFKRIKPDDSDFYLKLKKYVLSVDVMYSKALCLKYTDDDLGAINYFENTITRCTFLQKQLNEWTKNNSIDDTSLLEAYSKYLLTKQGKAFYDLISMYFTTHQYEEIEKELIIKVDTLSNKIKSNIINDVNYSPEKDELINQYLYYLLKIKEAQCCYELKESVLANHADINLEKYFNKLEKWGYILMNEQPLLFALSAYFDEIQGIIKKEIEELPINAFAGEKQESYKSEEVVKNKNIDEIVDVEDDEDGLGELCEEEGHSYSFKETRSISYINTKINYESPLLFSNWDLKNMEKLIQEILDSKHFNHYKELRDQTDKMHDFIIFIQSKVKSARS